MQLAAVVAAFGLTTPLAGCIPQDAFYPVMTAFLAAKPDFKADVSFASDGTIRASRFPFLHTAETGNERYGLEVLDSVRKLEDDVNGRLFGGAKTFLSYNSAPCRPGSSATLFSVSSLTFAS